MSLREIVESLLHEEESATLDFKQAQYKFEGATDLEKSELLKDVLAFANAWRRADAYILVGVAETRGARSNVHGVAIHIDDAKLQQFVNGKTNRPVDFSYTPMDLDGKQVGVIRISVQRRPIFLNKDFGSLTKLSVYIRRGSSTDVADPDEIAAMGGGFNQDVRQPKLEPFFVLVGENDVPEKSVNLRLVNFSIPEADKFPNYNPDGGQFVVLVS